MNENIAKEIFRKYRGMYFFMMREGNGDYELYKSFNISRQQEKNWLAEMQTEFKESYTNAQDRKQFLSAVSKYIDVTEELCDQSAVWSLCDYIEQNALNWDMRLTLDSTAILFDAKVIFGSDKVASQRFFERINNILDIAMKTAKDISECSQCQKTIDTLRKKGVFQIFTADSGFTL